VRREAEAEVWEQRMAPHLASLAEAQARRAELEAELEASRNAAREAEQLLATRQEEERAAQTALDELEAALVAAGARLPVREAELASARARWAALRARRRSNGGRVLGGEAIAQP